MSLKKLSNRLIEPSKHLSKADDVRRARLLSAMLIPLIVLTPIGSLTSSIPAEQTSVGFLFFAVTIAYFFSRTKHYLYAGIFAVISMLIPPYAMLFSLDEFTQFTIVTTLSWMNLSLLSGSIWLPMKPIFIIWLINLVFILLIPILFLDNLTYQALSTGFMQLLVFGSIILMSARLRNNDQADLIVQTKKMKIAKDEAVFANNAKSTFLANMSHELRTPLHGVLSFSKFGIDNSGKISEEKITSYFEKIHSSAKRLRTLVENLLNLHSLEKGEAEFDFKSVKLLPLIEECISREANNLKKKNNFITLDYSSEITDIECDANSLSQAVQNILDNAIKFSPDGGEIIISVTPGFIGEMQSKIDAVEIKVSDQGIGVNDSEYDLLFTKFYKGENIGFITGSTGLGLAISSGIVSKHNGNIRCENNPGSGATFYIKLPVKHITDSEL